MNFKLSLNQYGSHASAISLTRMAFLSTLAVLMVILSGCDRPNRIELLKYKNAIKERRAQKNKAFKFSANSPIANTQRWEFKELQYFPVDPEYQVEASYTPVTDEKEFQIQTSSGYPRVYVTIGMFDFRLKGKDLRLMAYQEKVRKEQGNSDSLFVPFTDETTGKSTYGAGRYLDLKKPQDGMTVIDFNLSYNPYCAYNISFSCPIPPQENFLKISIEAGEKTYALH